MFVYLVLVLESCAHADTLIFNLTNAVINTSWNSTPPDVWVGVFVGTEDYYWPEALNTYTPSWGTAHTWNDVNDTLLSRVYIFVDDMRLVKTIGYKSFNLSSSSYKSSEDNPVIHRVNFIGIDNVDYVIAAITITTSCSTFATQSICESNSCVWNSTSRACEEPGPDSGNVCSSYTVDTCDRQSTCAWYKNVCYPTTWLCSKYTCDSCSSTVACAKDPDMNAAGGCTWDSSKNACYNASAIGCEKVCAEANAGCKPSCLVNIEGCPCLCDTDGCVLETVGLPGERKKWDHSTFSTEFDEKATLPHSSRTESFLLPVEK